MDPSRVRIGTVAASSRRQFAPALREHTAYHTSVAVFVCRHSSRSECGAMTVQAIMTPADWREMRFCSVAVARQRARMGDIHYDLKSYEENISVTCRS
jgi:hypothetical protein